MPPATATSMSPSDTAWAASMTAFNPDPQTLLMVRAATSLLRPPLSAACLAGFCPTPAEMTLPTMHSSTSDGSTPGTCHRLANGNGAELGGLQAFQLAEKLSGRESSGADDNRCSHVTSRQDASRRPVPRSVFSRRENHRRRPLQLRVPSLIGWMHIDRSIGLQPDRADAAQRIADRHAPRDLELPLRHRSVAKQFSRALAARRCE